MTTVQDLITDLLPECSHRHQDIRALKCSNGAIQYVYQCLDCGERVGQSAIKKADVIRLRGPLEFILPFDDLARQQAQDRKREMWRAAADAKRRDIARQRAKEDAQFAAWYAEYLNSSEWKRKRAKVMQRAGGICEGCMEARATDVHHLTYKHVGDELLFELAALCRSCHDRAHGRDRQQEASA